MKRGILPIVAVAASMLATVARAGEEAPVRAEIFARLPQSVGNIAMTPDNQLIFSHHPFFSPDIRVARLTSPTTFQPFPNADWNTPKKGSDQYLDNVLGLRSDENGIVWIIDMGFRTKITPKLVGWNTRTDKLERIYYMPEPITRSGSQPQDIVIDQKNRKFYVADEDIGPGGDGSHAAIIIIDMDTGRARRVLDGDKSTVPENVPITVDGKDLTVPGKDGKPTIIKVGCDGITMDVQSEWVYFAPLSAKVERYSDKPNNGGLSIDYAGNLYLTAVETRSVGVVGADRKYRTYLSDPEMVWPDGITASPDGYMYVSASQISAAAMFHGGKAENKTPYLIYRFKPLAAGYVSR